MGDYRIVRREGDLALRVVWGSGFKFFHLLRYPQEGLPVALNQTDEEFKHVEGSDPLLGSGHIENPRAEHRRVILDL